MPEPQALTAVLWDFGGVILSSPFEAFNRYEAEQGLPLDFIRSVNATDPHHNAWARLERNELSPVDFDEAFAADRPVVLEMKTDPEVPPVQGRCCLARQHANPRHRVRNRCRPCRCRI